MTAVTRSLERSVQRSEGVWSLAWKRLQGDRVGRVSMAVVALFAVLLLAAASGLVASNWQAERGVSYAPLPVLLAVMVGISPQMRLYRSFFLDEIGHDYVRTARAKGLPEGTIMVKHVLRNALVPIVTVLGLTMALMIGGTVVTETVFNLPGVGNLVVRAVLRRDYPVIQGTLLVIAAIYVFINLAIDFLYTLVDPRIRLEAP